MDRDEYIEAGRERRRELEAEELEMLLASAPDERPLPAPAVPVDEQFEREFREFQHEFYGAGRHNPDCD